MQALKELWGALTDVIYPRVCVACEEHLLPKETDICFHCQYQLPFTDYASFSDNPVARHFWGKVPVAAATALFHFHKEGPVQQMLHQLKYKNRKDIGVLLGKMLANRLAVHPVFSTCQYVTPVPLHPRKERSRGYNQSQLIAQGYAEVSGTKCLTEVLRRVTHTGTQTKKGRLERWKNVDGKFMVQPSEQLAGAHILLLDDVVTTGATLEACVQALLLIPGIQVSVAAIAHAEL